MIDLRNGLLSADLEEIEIIRADVENILGKSIDTDTIKKDMKFKPRITEKGLLIHQKDKNKYYFKNERTFTRCIKELFSDNTLLPRLIAKKAYILDEGETWEEVYPMKRSVGYVFREKQFVESNLIKITFRTLPFGKRDTLTGLPVRIDSIMLVVDDNEKEVNSMNLQTS